MAAAPRRRVGGARVGLKRAAAPPLPVPQLHARAAKGGRQRAVKRTFPHICRVTPTFPTKAPRPRSKGAAEGTPPPPCAAQRRRPSLLSDHMEGKREALQLHPALISSWKPADVPRKRKTELPLGWISRRHVDVSRRRLDAVKGSCSQMDPPPPHIINVSYEFSGPTIEAGSD